MMLTAVIQNNRCSLLVNLLSRCTDFFYGRKSEILQRLSTPTAIYFIDRPWASFAPIPMSFVPNFLPTLPVDLLLDTLHHFFSLPSASRRDTEKVSFSSKAGTLNPQRSMKSLPTLFSAIVPRISSAGSIRIWGSDRSRVDLSDLGLGWLDFHTGR